MKTYIYPDSMQFYGRTLVFITMSDNCKGLMAVSQGTEPDELFDSLEGTASPLAKGRAKLCPLNGTNARAIRQFFPYTNPVSHAGKKITVGLGDRLGLASAGHVRLIKNLDVFPVLAQQSIRELTLTNRTYNDVLDSATWAVFQECYEKGYGADGDHLKTAAEVTMALNCGFTMITLDCSEHINNAALTLPDNEIESLWCEIPENSRTAYLNTYDGKTFNIGAVSVSFPIGAIKRIAVIYAAAIRHAVDIYKNTLATCGRKVDFELSIDETLSETSPESHFFVANELKWHGVEAVSLAPRFCGEFQKGIDYRGDLSRFKREFAEHASIARHFGYKISVHSGSDKFSVFETVGRETNGEYHLKTAGTNWLEALRVIAKKDPALFRRIVKFALTSLSGAKKFYHITENTANIPNVDSLTDDKLPELLNQDDARQVLHITYGALLTACGENGELLFKTDIYAVLNKYEEDYYEALETHIGRHLKSLGVINHTALY